MFYYRVFYIILIKEIGLMDNEKYPEFSQQNEEVASSNQTHEEFDVEKYERTSKQYKRWFFISLIATIAVFMVDVADLIWLLSSGKNFTGFDFFTIVGLLVLDVLSTVMTVHCYDRWKEYE